MQEVSSRGPTILPLPDDVASQITSSTAISSLTSVVTGLIENALDAGASNIDVSVDYRRAACTVEDDGYGIEPKEFAEDGGLGKRFYTSKYKSSVDMYGGHGTFLSSVAALSILSVTSRQQNRLSQSSLVLHHSRPAARFLKAPAHHSLSLHGHGTRVVVQDLFGNMPVRVKQRAGSPGKRGRADDKEFELLKKQLIRLVLSSQRSVHILLSEAGSEARKSHIGVRPSFSKHEKEERPAASIDVLFLCKVLAYAGYIEPTGWDTWIKISARTLNITIQGAISLQPAPSKNVQFVSLGIRPLEPNSGHNMIFEDVNKLFALSSFGNQEQIVDMEHAKWSKGKRLKQDGFTNRQLRRGGKGVDRWPMFYIRIDLGGGNDAKKLEREATLNNVLKVLGAMIHGFLKDNHFRPRAVARTTRGSPGTQRKEEKLERAVHSEAPFSSWSRIKSSNRPESSTSLRPKTNVPESTKKSTSLSVSPHILGQTQPEKRLVFNGAGDEIIEWTNPVSKATVLINRRTGLTARPTTEDRPSTAPADLQHSRVDGRLTRASSRGFMTPQKGSWADDLLSKWENPVFAPPTEKPIPQATLSTPRHDAIHGQCSHTSDAPSAAALTHIHSTLSTRLSKASLQSAQIIAQVDRKFILISVSFSKHSNLLALVDQHAADERIRFEYLLQDLQTRPPVPVITPLVFEIPSREHNLFSAHTSFFRRWGITYTLAPASAPATAVTTGTNPQTTRLTISTLPVPIAARCQQEPKLLINLLRSEVWTLDSSPSALPTSTPPRGIMDLLSSRACRSAIMFNDVLSMEECRVLVERLAACGMPWTCAHGRPSMVPLIDVGAPGDVMTHGEMGFTLEGRSSLEYGDDTEENAKESSFGEAWAAWKGEKSQ